MLVFVRSIRFFVWIDSLFCIVDSFLISVFGFLNFGFLDFIFVILVFLILFLRCATIIIGCFVGMRWCVIL